MTAIFLSLNAFFNSFCTQHTCQPSCNRDGEKEQVCMISYHHGMAGETPACGRAMAGPSGTESPSPPFTRWAAGPATNRPGMSTTAGPSDWTGRSGPAQPVRTAPVFYHARHPCSPVAVAGTPAGPGTAMTCLVVTWTAGVAGPCQYPEETTSHPFSSTTPGPAGTAPAGNNVTNAIRISLRPGTSMYSPAPLLFRDGSRPPFSGILSGTLRRGCDFPATGPFTTSP